ncbi:uncharacterized [Tachysurus ichikawai]
MDTGGGNDNSTTFSNPPVTLAQQKQLPLRCPTSETRPTEKRIKESRSKVPCFGDTSLIFCTCDPAAQTFFFIFLPFQFSSSIIAFLVLL